MRDATETIRDAVTSTVAPPVMQVWHSVRFGAPDCCRSSTGCDVASRSSVGPCGSPFPSPRWRRGAAATAGSGFGLRYPEAMSRGDGETEAYRAYGRAASEHRQLGTRPPAPPGWYAALTSLIIGGGIMVGGGVLVIVEQHRPAFLRSLLLFLVGVVISLWGIRGIGRIPYTRDGRTKSS